MVRLIFALLAVLLLAGMAVGFLGALHPAFDTLAHFRWHLALALLAMTLIGLALKIRQAPFILMIFALIGVWQSGAGNRIGNASALASDTTATNEFSLLQFNLRFDNSRKDDVIAMLRRYNPDLLVLNETSKDWNLKLEELFDTWPNRFHCPEWREIGGSMIFSKFPLRQDRDFCHAYAAIGLTEVLVHGKWIELGTVHLRWPWPASGPRQLREIKPRLREVGPDALVAGDFNATVWSNAVQDFARNSQMTVARGFGGTWMHEWLPTSLAPFLGFPIDNLMTKGKVRLLTLETLPDTGSDHLPLLARLRVSE